MEEMRTDGLYIVLISVHGLIRGRDPELGRDADTGGQTKYVVELATALARHPRVGRVDLLTRRIIDPGVEPIYGQAIEPLADGAQIVRLPSGPDEYIRKEALWDYLDNFADHALDYLHRQNQRPSLIHSHYADAGYVGTRIANLLDIPLLHTGHSLGRVKRRRLLAKGLSRQQIEEHYNISRRIEAEEETLAVADRVITSTHNEIEDQYGLYDHYQPAQMRVIPPGIDLHNFHPPGNDACPFEQELTRFLRKPEKPMILALSRPDERKNITTLVEAYGRSKKLRSLANLVIVAGNRDDIHELDSGPQAVLEELLYLIDLYDLYGQVAYPKHHAAEEVPAIYRLAARRKGVFINPALTEPFGLTLLEAAASGLPVVATEDGGPRDIIALCDNGKLINPLDIADISRALLELLGNRKLWQNYAENGLQGVRRHYSWDAHVESYVEMLEPLLQSTPPRAASAPLPKRRLHYQDRALIVELDSALLGNGEEALQQLFSRLQQQRHRCGFGIATGRSLESTLQVLKQHKLPAPDVLIVGMGSEIYYAPQLMLDLEWDHHIDNSWSPRAIRRLLDPLSGLKAQAKKEQLRYKISYYIDPRIAPPIEEIKRLLHQEGITANVFFSHGQFLDILPVRASKGLALRFFASQWDIPLQQVLAIGGSAADEDMLRGNTLAAVTDNLHQKELRQIAELEGIYFAGQSHVAGILEAIEHYRFLPETV